MPIAQNKYPPQNHSAFLALAEEMERVKKMEGGTAFIVDLIEAVVESQGLIVVDKAEYESLSPGKVEGWREERDELYGYVNGLLGLLQLLRGRNDIPAEVKEIMNTNHRATDAAAYLTHIVPPISSRAEDS